MTATAPNRTHWLWGEGASQTDRLPIVIDEFGAGHNDDCGPNSNHMLVAFFTGTTPTYAGMDAIRDRDIKHGWFVSGGGQGLYDIVNDIKTYQPDVSTSMTPYNVNGLSESLIRSRLKDMQTLANQGNSVGAVVNIRYGGKLPYNQPGVTGHYVALMGYDPATDMVLIGNGDRVPLPKGTGKPDWMPLSGLMGATVKGMVIMRRSGIPDSPTVKGENQPAEGSGILSALGLDLSWFKPERVAKLALGIALIGLAVFLTVNGMKAGIVAEVLK